MVDFDDIVGVEEQDPATAIPTAATPEPSNLTPQEQALQGIQKSLEPPDLTGADFDSIETSEDAYGGLGQQAITFGEGLLEGAVGPLAPLVERGLGVDPNKIRGRKEENPITQGAGQAVGLGAGILTGTGVGGAMTRAGQIATEAVGLAKAAEGASYGYRVGSAIVREAAESAILQGSNEVSKMIIQDPDASAETAIGNIGLAGVMGGIGGGLFAGAVSPLWNATAGPKVEGMLSAVKSHLDGVPVALTPRADEAASVLGVPIAPELRTAMSGRRGAEDAYTTLQYTQDKNIQESVIKLEKDLSDRVGQSLGVDIEAAKVYDKSDAGTAYNNALAKEYSDKYKKFDPLYKEEEEILKTVSVDDETRLAFMGKVIEDGMEKVGTHSPYYKAYEAAAERIGNEGSLSGLDKFRRELYNDAVAAKAAKDVNKSDALFSIRSNIDDFIETQIEKQSAALEKEGAEYASAIGSDIIKDRRALKQEYKAFTKIRKEMHNHIGYSKIYGNKGFLDKLTEIGPEGLVAKFSPKNNAGIVPFLQKHFPDTLEEIRQQELKELIKPAITNVKGEMPVNFEKLASILGSKDAGQSKLLEFVLPPGSREVIDAAKTLMDSLPKRRDSGTPGGFMKVFKDMPRSVLAVLGIMLGNNPISGLILGEAAQRLGRDVPNAIRLGYLKFLGSDQPIKAEGFKAMIDFFEHTAKGENTFSKATKAVFKSGAEVLALSQIPDEKSREKLDKTVSKMQDAPDRMFGLGESAVGHYLPEHQASLAKSATTAMQYLNTIKPQPVQLSPLDKPIQPTAEQKARYNRALDIAQQPAIVLKHIKDGTLLTTDLQDLMGMYPALYKRMANKLSMDMQNMAADEEPIPYKTRMGISLFLGQAVDSTMDPVSIQSMQASYIPAQPPQQGPKPQGKSMKALGKTNKNYQTPLQASESDRASRTD